MQKFLVLAFVLSLLLLVFTTVGAAPYYDEDFSEGSLPIEWVRYSGSEPTISNGILTIPGSTSPVMVSDTFLDLPAVGHFELIMTARLAANSGWGFVLTVRMNMQERYGTTGYQLAVKPYEVVLGKQGPNGFKTITTKSTSVDLSQFHVYRLRAEGNRLRVWVDDVEYFDYTDTGAEYPELYTEGQFAFKANRTTLLIDRITINVLETAVVTITATAHNTPGGVIYPTTAQPDSNPQPGTNGGSAPMISSPRRSISAANPLYILTPSNWGLSDTWGRLPADIKAYSALLAWGNRSNNNIVYTELDEAQRNGIPLVVQLRTFWAVRDERDYPDKVAPLPFVEEILRKYSCIVAVLIAEQAASGFMDEERAYTSSVIKLAARYGVHTILVESYHHYFSELMLDQEFFDLVRTYRAWVIPMWELIGEGDLYSTFAQITGLWASDVVDNWGMNCQTWYWWSAGFKGLGESYGPFFRQALATNPQLEDIVRSQFPLYGQVIAMGATAGASVYWIGGERPPHVWSFDGYTFSDFWQDTIQPLFRALTEYGMIATKEEFRANLKVGIINDCGFPFVWDDGVAHTGASSLRIDNFQNGGPASLAWGSSAFIPVHPGHVCYLSFWVKTEDVDSRVYGSISWYGSKGWLRNTDTISAENPTADWHRLSVRAKVPNEATHATINLYSASGYHGKVWFDDISFRDETTDTELLENTSVEEAGTKKWRPSGWRVSQWRSIYERKDTTFAGLLQLWHETYGILHHAELIPNSGRYFFIPIVPPGTSVPDRVKLVTMTYLLENGVDKVLTEWAPSSPETEGLAIGYPSRFLLSNSHENTDVSQSVRLALDELSLAAILGVHNYLLGHRLTEGRWVVVVENRTGRKTSFSVEGTTPVRVRFLRGDGKVETTRENTARVEVDHGRTKLAIVEIRVR